MPPVVVAVTTVTAATTRLIDFVRGLPAYYRTLDAREPFILVVVGLHVVLVSGLVLARRSPAGTLLVLFLVLVASYFSPSVAEVLGRHEDVLLARGLLRSSRDPGTLLLATWTLPAFVYAFLFAFLLIVGLLREIRASVARGKTTFTVVAAVEGQREER